MSPFGAKASRMGFVSDPASFVWVKPGGRTWLIGVATVAEALKDVDDSVPVSVAVSDRAPPAAAVIWPVIVTVQACPAARVAALHRDGRAGVAAAAGVRRHPRRGRKAADNPLAGYVKMAAEPVAASLSAVQSVPLATGYEAEVRSVVPFHTVNEYDPPNDLNEPSAGVWTHR
jgi:hypothetical protein